MIDDPKMEKVYFVTDFVRNGSLMEKITKRILSIDEIRMYFRDLISALEYCHECAGVLHRDIKPENILIDDKNRLKLADFGVSQFMENQNDLVDTKAGTNFYFSPEACKGKSYRGKPTDVWACGVVLFYMRARRFPFMS